MSRSLQQRGSRTARALAVGGALVLSLAVTGCGSRSSDGGAADNAVTGAIRAGVSTMRTASVGHLRAAEARDFLAAHPEALVLDIREPAELDGAGGSIDGARRIPLGELPARLGEIESWKNKPVIVVGSSGRSGMDAGRTLLAAGFQQVMNLEGGVVAWSQGGE